MFFLPMSSPAWLQVPVLQWYFGLHFG
ncbi:hypothetical protein G9444_0618 [Rhodococcus erythropolis]|uniref:Uncharacterized protein n=1 Tax=Rhodococcus erythropolis TaxID=1833 RepID=A0A6G9CLW4_RHOER|nr:hypothetical protein G9444_0618 [Rhodococcus erythropolis]